MRSHFYIKTTSPDCVFLVDKDEGTSMTNDAESVCEWADKNFPGKRVIYYDTTGRWDEMIHKDGVFKGFAPYHGMTPKM
jgi:hypothetical protein